MAPALDIHVGKWFTPSIGARVGYSGLQAKGWTTAGTKYAKGADGSMFKEKFGVSYLHADAMWHFSNAVSGYKRPAPGISYPSSEWVGRVPTATTPTTTKSASTQVC